MQQRIEAGYANSKLLGFAKHRILLDDEGKPFDYEYLEANTTFLRLTGLQKKDIIGCTVRELFPNIENDSFNWIAFYGEVALKGGEDYFEQYSSVLKRWYWGYLCSEEKYIFSTLFLDITQQKETIGDFENFFSLNHDLFCITDSEGNFIKKNRSWSRTIDCIAHTEKSNFFDFLCEPELADTKNKIKLAIQNKELLIFTTKFISNGSQPSFIEWSFYPNENNNYIVGRDITKRLEEEKKHFESKQKFESLINNIPGVAYRCKNDKDWTMLLLTPNSTEVLGYDEDELVKNKDITFEQVIYKDDRKLVRDTIDKFMSINQPWQVEYRINHKNGSIRWVHEKGRAVYNQLGELAYLDGFIYDITARINAQTSLAKVVEQQQILLDNIQTHVWYLYDEKTYGLVNLAHANFWGLKPEEMSFKTFYELFDKEIADNMLKINKKSFETKKAVQFFTHFKNKNNDSRYLSISQTPKFAEDGTVEYLVCSAEDLTDGKKSELKLAESEKRFKILFNQSQDPMALLSSPNWSFVEMNPAALNLYGLTPDNDIRQTGPWDFAPKLQPNGTSSLDMAIENINTAMKKGSCFFEYTHSKVDGTPISCTVLLSKITSEDQTFLQATIRDITEEKEAQKKLNEAIQAAEAANKAKSQFLANMSHEIRTPLNGVIGFTELLKKTPLNSLQQEYVNSANISGHTLLSIINDILDFSKIEADMMNLEIIRTDIIELLNNIVDIIKYPAAQKDLEVLLDVDSQIPRFAMLDPVRLKQILANLLGNALKFTERGEIELKVTYSKIDENSGKISFFIRDTGIGISETQREKLFKAFSQGDSSTTRKFGGTGLGLIISEMIAKKMDSEINVTSVQGKGTTFYFNIITQTAEGSKLDPSKLAAIKRCLVIDDNANNRKILQQMLSEWKIEVECCENGLLALVVIDSSEPFDVIICDYHMPYLDGLETIKMIRERQKKDAIKPIILLHSSSDDAEMHRKCDELNVLFRLCKPVKSDELFQYLFAIHDPMTIARKPKNTFQNQEPRQDLLYNEATIILAEDVSINMMMITALLKDLLPCSKIIQAENGLQAVAFYKAKKPDLIFMDVQMPEMDGIDATKTIRILEQTSGRHTPIIALTAGALKQEQERCQQAGMNDFLLKPIESEKIMSILKKYLGTEKTIDYSKRFDKEELLKRLGDKELLISNLIASTKNDMPNLLNELIAAIKNGEAENIRKKAHIIKGVSLNMQLTILSQIAGEISEIAGFKDNKEILVAKIQELESEWELAEELLSQALS